jgi:hypothetical protein
MTEWRPPRDRRAAMKSPTIAIIALGSLFLGTLQAAAVHTQPRPLSASEECAIRGAGPWHAEIFEDCDYSVTCSEKNRGSDTCFGLLSPTEPPICHPQFSTCPPLIACTNTSDSARKCTGGFWTCPRVDDIPEKECGNQYLGFCHDGVGSCTCEQSFTELEDCIAIKAECYP